MAVSSRNYTKVLSKYFLPCFRLLSHQGHQGKMIGAIFGSSDRMFSPKILSDFSPSLFFHTSLPDFSARLLCQTSPAFFLCLLSSPTVLPVCLLACLAEAPGHRTAFVCRGPGNPAAQVACRQTSKLCDARTLFITQAIDSSGQALLGLSPLQGEDDLALGAWRIAGLLPSTESRGRTGGAQGAGGQYTWNGKERKRMTPWSWS